MVTTAKPVAPTRTATFYCSDCGVPVARVQGNILTILSTHHGDRHETDLRIPVVDNHIPLRIA